MYTWQGMDKVTHQRARELFGKKEVYRLYDDNTEGLVSDLEDIDDHNEKGGEFGIHKDDKTLQNLRLATLKHLIYESRDNTCECSELAEEEEPGELKEFYMDCIKQYEDEEEALEWAFLALGGEW